MNGLQSFGNNVIQGAKMVNPGSLYRGAKQLGSDVLNQAFGKKKQAIASKMSAPAPLKPEAPQYNQGFNAYKSYLDQVNKS